MRRTCMKPPGSTKLLGHRFVPKPNTWSRQMPVNPHNPTEEELREWAYSEASEEPVQEWGLILSWQMDRGLLRRCIRFACDPNCPHADFFLGVLYLWVEGLAKREDFVATRGTYDDWLEGARGIDNVAVKRWRHRARLIFQGLEPFDRTGWWKLALSDRQSGC